MLDSFERQVLRACLADLSARVAPKVQDPAAAASLGMTSRLLAHLLSRDPEAAFSERDAEVAALQAEEAQEDKLLAPAASDHAFSVEALSEYLGARLPGAKVAAIEASLGGFSKRTLLLKLSGAPQLDDSVVIRCDEAGGPVESAAADELGILKLMNRHGVPVAEPIFADPTFVLGGSVLCTRRLNGGSAYDATGSVLGPKGPQAAHELARILAQVHAVPVAELDIDPAIKALGVREHVRRMVAGYQDQWRRNQNRPSPVLDSAFDYLLSHIPAEAGAATVVHGDASLRNLLLDGDRASGLVDWELWHLGDPVEDLAFCRPEIEQVMAWDAFLAEYRSHGGVSWQEQAGAYYGMFGAVRNAVFGATILHHFAQAQAPETRFVFAALYLARKLVSDVARRLKALGV